MKAKDFKRMFDTGQIKVGAKGRLESGNLDPAYEELLKLSSKSNTPKKRKSKKRDEYLTQENIYLAIHKYFLQGSIYIPYNVVSSKNSKDIVWSKGKRHSVLVQSKAYRRYQTLSKKYWIENRLLFEKLIASHKKPYNIGFFFIRFNDEAWDYHNMIQGPADMMVKYNWINDDDKKTIRIIPEGHTISKDFQGLVITPIKRIIDAKERELPVH